MFLFPLSPLFPEQGLPMEIVLLGGPFVGKGNLVLGGKLGDRKTFACSTECANQSASCPAVPRGHRLVPDQHWIGAWRLR